MPSRAVVTFALLTLPALAQGATKPTVATGSVPVSSTDILGHVCPVTPQLALTARHVVDKAKDHGSEELLVTRGDLEGGSDPRKAGVLVTRKREILDLAVVGWRDGLGAFPQPLHIATAAPPEGAWVLMVGYDYAHALRPRIVRARILHQMGAAMFYSDAAGPGSSGGCVVLEQTGEVVAVHVGVMDGAYGIGTPVWGDWGLGLLDDPEPAQAEVPVAWSLFKGHHIQ